MGGVSGGARVGQSGSDEATSERPEDKAHSPTHVSLYVRRGARGSAVLACRRALLRNSTHCSVADCNTATAGSIRIDQLSISIDRRMEFAFG